MIPLECGRLADRQAHVGRLPANRVLAYIRRARAAFGRRPDSPYQASQDLGDDFRKLNLFTLEDQIETIRACLQEITPEQYAGPDPPDHLACEPKCRGERLLQFVYASPFFKGKRMCFKFAINASGRSVERLVVVRLHEAYDPNKFAKLERKR